MMRGVELLGDAADRFEAPDLFAGAGVQLLKIVLTAGLVAQDDDHDDSDGAEVDQAHTQQGDRRLETGDLEPAAEGEGREVTAQCEDAGHRGPRRAVAEAEIEDW